MPTTGAWATFFGVAAVVAAVTAICVFIGQSWKVGRSLYTIAERVEMVPALKADLDLLRAEQAEMREQLNTLSEIISPENAERARAAARELSRQRQHREEGRG